jgi:uncharacterized protein (TIGR03437 family)
MSVFAASLALAPAASAASTTGRQWIVILNEKPVVEQYPGRIERTRAVAEPYRQHLQQAQAALRPRIEGMHVRVTGSVQHLLNGMFVVATPAQAAALRKLPGVKAVAPLRRYRKADQLGMSNVQSAWSELGSSTGSNAGAGIKIGIIDTGIDQTHPAFQDPTLVAPAGFPKYDNAADQAFTTNKVIVARSYVSDIVDSDDVNPDDLPAQSRPDDLTARDLDGHGTGVASVAAGVNTTYNGVSITGVAPKAFLGNYKIFGSDDVNPNGSGNILQALEDAVTDGMDVVNLSLGSPAAYYGPLDTDSTYCVQSGLPNSPIAIPSDACDPLAYEVENAMDNALVTVVVAAGNEGANGYLFNYGCGSPPCLSTPTFSSMGSPAYAPSAIAVGGIQNDVTYVQEVQISGTAVPSNVQTIDAFESYDGPPPDSPVTGTLVDETQTANSLCNASPTALPGDIVLVEQGTCDDVTMVTNAQNAGAAGVIELANAAEYFLPYGLSGTAIPTFIIGQSDGANLKSYIDSSPGAKATMDPKPYQVSAQSLSLTPYSVAYFSSRGPVNETGALKPDLVAVATDFLMPTESYDPDGGLFNFARYGASQGTSFATPMVTGSAALVKQSNPSLTPLQIKSALVNTASASNLVTSDGSAQASVSEVGAGLLQTNNAVKSTVQVVPSTVSFGMQGTASFPTVPALTLYNTGTGQVTLTMNVVQSTGFSTSATTVLVNGSSSATVTIPAGTASSPGKTSVNVTLTGSEPAPGRYEGVIAATGGPVPLTIPYMYLIPSGVPYDVIPLNGVEPGQGFNAFDGAVGAYIAWYTACDSGNNACINDYGPIAVQVVDQYGAPVPNAEVVWGVTEGSGLIDLNNSDSATNADGVAGAAVYLGSTAGPQEVSVNVVGTSLTLPFDGYARVAPALTSIQDAASYQSGPIAPGSWIAVYGSNLTDTTQGNDGTNFPFATCSACNVLNQPLPMGIDGAAFSFDTPGQTLSVPGRFSYVSPGQLNVQIPWELTGQTTATVKSIVNYTYSPEVTFTFAEYSPGFYQVPIGSANAAGENPDYSIVTEGNPATRGSYVQLFMNGLGPVNCTAGAPYCTSSNQPADGLAAPSTQLAKTMATPTVTIGGQPATVLFSGLAPGFASLYQVNVDVPSNIATGRQPITFTIGGVTAPAAYLYVK